MANLIPVPSFDNVRQHETTDLVLAGPGQPMNQQAQSLLNRTQFNKNAHDQFLLDLANSSDAAKGAALSGYKGRTVQERLSESPNIQDFGGSSDGVTNNSPAFSSASGVSIDLEDGSFLIDSSIIISKAARMSGNGTPTVIKASASFPAGVMIILAPVAGADPRGWIVEDICLLNEGGAVRGITIDLAPAGRFLFKLIVRNIISKSDIGPIFFELQNFVNIDGFFTSVIEDCWSYGGFYLENVGDSIFLNRNTTTGSGRGYYIKQLASASNITITGGSCTCSGGALLLASGFNVNFDDMQVECHVPYTGTEPGLVTANGGGVFVTNLRITNSNVNTLVNASLYDIYIDWTLNAEIEGNTLICNTTTGAHIVIGSNSVNTHIGRNTYLSSNDGSNINPRIVDDGVGTSGIWKLATLLSWTTLIDPVSGFQAGFYKDKDGEVFLRGNLTGSASIANQTLFTLPVGFRSNAKNYSLPASTGASSVIINVLQTGEVQISIAGVTAVYLDGLSFSTK